MAQVSRRKLNQKTEDEIFNLFWKFLVRIRQTEVAEQFYSDFLTETERLILAKRLVTALLLIRKNTTQEIERKVSVSSSTVSNTSQWLKYCRPETKKMLERLAGEAEFVLILEGIESGEKR